MDNDTEAGRLRAKMLGQYNYLPDHHPAAGKKANEYHEKRSARLQAIKEHEHPYWEKK